MAQYTLDGSEKKIKVLGLYASIKNNSDTVIYAGQHTGINPSATNVTPIQAGESISIPANSDKCIYLLGTGDVAIISGNEWVNFFKPAPNGGGGTGGGGITQQQLNDTLKLYETVANSDKKLKNKADKSEIPTSLPADGGNSDTVGQYTPQQLIQSNPNLLDNPDFKINQRGKKEYTVYDSPYCYTADRWRIVTNTHSKVNIENDGSVKLTATETDVPGEYCYCVFEQNIENLNPGDVVTISAMLRGNGAAAFGQTNGANLYIPALSTDYKVYSHTIVLNASTKDAAHGLGVIFNNEEKSLNDTWVQAKWLQAEMGTVTTTFVSPNLALELAKCQRYYQVIDGVYMPATVSSDLGAFWFINLSNHMRIAPSIILPTITDDDLMVGAEGANTNILGGWSWGQYCGVVHPGCIQINMVNVDPSKHALAWKLFANTAPIGLSADL